MSDKYRPQLSEFSQQVLRDLANGWQFWRSGPAASWEVFPGKTQRVPAGTQPETSSPFPHERLQELIETMMIEITGSTSQRIVPRGGRGG